MSTYATQMDAAKQGILTPEMETVAKEEHLEQFDREFEAAAGETSSLLASNVANTRTFEVKTPDVMIKVHPDRTDLVETRLIDGIPYLMIQLSDSVEVNGIPVTNKNMTPLEE